METQEILVKSSSGKLELLRKVLSGGVTLGGGAGQAVFWDKFYHPDSSWGESAKAIFDPRSDDPSRQMMGGLNAGLGTAAMIFGRKGITSRPAKTVNKWGGGGTRVIEKVTPGTAKTNLLAALGFGMMAPSKDALIAGGSLASDVKKILPDAKDAMNRPPAEMPEGMTTRDKLIAAVLGAGALGVGGYGISRLSKSMDEQSNAANSGRVTLTLPTKNPHDVETQVSIPLRDAGVSAKTYNQLGRDVRRRLRGESKERKLAYIEAIESGMNPDEANMLKLSSEDAAPSLLAGSHIKSIAAEHAPPAEEVPQEAPEKYDDKPLKLKFTEQGKKMAEQEKRIKQLEKYLGQANGDKLTQVRANLSGIKKSAYSPTIGQVNATPAAFNTQGGIQGLNIHKPMLFGPKFQQLKNLIQPVLSNSQNPFISKLFGQTKPSEGAIIPMQYNP